jgi:hypothetical protein
MAEHKQDQQQDEREEGQRPLPSDPPVANQAEMEAVRAEERARAAGNLPDDWDVVSLDAYEEELFNDGVDTAVAEDIAHFTDEPEIQSDFAERQELNTGSRAWHEKLAQHHAKSPNLSGEDIDAAWDEANVGEETVGGDSPTPDQDIVEELGEAMGLTYQDNELLGIEDKLLARDRHRWELDPASADEETALVEGKTLLHDPDADTELRNPTLDEFAAPEEDRE